MLSVIAHLTSFTFAVWAALYVIRRINGCRDSEGAELAILLILGQITFGLFLMR